MDGEGQLDLGPCCACLIEKNSVRNLLALPNKNPHGQGWGCFACHLPAEGALAVVCDKCLESDQALKFYIVGFPQDKKRAPIEELTEPFDHDLRYHPEVKANEGQVLGYGKISD